VKAAPSALKEVAYLFLRLGSTDLALLGLLL
jgi:hypothetical protein